MESYKYSLYLLHMATYMLMIFELAVLDISKVIFL